MYIQGLEVVEPTYDCLRHSVVVRNLFCSDSAPSPGEYFLRLAKGGLPDGGRARSTLVGGTLVDLTEGIDKAHRFVANRVGASVVEHSWVLVDLGEDLEQAVSESQRRVKTSPDTFNNFQHFQRHVQNIFGLPGNIALGQRVMTIDEVGLDRPDKTHFIEHMVKARLTVEVDKAARKYKWRWLNGIWPTDMDKMEQFTTPPYSVGEPTVTSLQQLAERGLTLVDTDPFLSNGWE